MKALQQNSPQTQDREEFKANFKSSMNKYSSKEHSRINKRLEKEFENRISGIDKIFEMKDGIGKSPKPKKTFNNFMEDRIEEVVQQPTFEELK